MQQSVLDSELSDGESREIAKAVPLDSDEAAAGFAIQTVEQLCDRIGIPKTLTELGVTHDQIPAIVVSSRGNSMSGNPKTLNDDELTIILRNMTG